MISAMFYSENGLGILLSGWESEFLRLVFTVEILAIVLGVIIGLLLPPLRVIKGISLAFTAFGLLLVRSVVSLASAVTRKLSIHMLEKFLRSVPDCICLR